MKEIKTAPMGGLNLFLHGIINLKSLKGRKCMLSVKTIENKIITKLRDLPEEGKREVLKYIENLKNKKTEKTLKLLKKTAGAWKGLVDAEKLKKTFLQIGLNWIYPNE